MKRILALFMAVVLTVGFLPSAAFAAEGDGPMVVATADKSTIKPGETLTITYTLDHDLDYMTRLDLVLKYDATLFQFVSTDIEGSVWFNEPAQNGPLGSGTNATVRIRENNDDNEDTISAGKLCSITFTALDSIDSAQTASFYNGTTGIARSSIVVDDGETFLGLVQYRVGYYANLADDTHPTVGDYPPSIVTNLDGASLDMTSQTFPLTVIARTNAELGAGVIYSNQIQVTLDGKVVEKSYGDSQPTYELYFEAPQSGDEETHIVRVLAWDGNGNSTMKVYAVTYHQISEGDPAGSVNVVLDATTIGLGILDTGTLDIVEGETAASVLLRFLQEYGYDPDYQGTATMNFYLRRINRGDIAYRANVPEHLWELILRDGITTNDNYDRDSIGEFDYTQGSGWMYSINGTLYEGTGMSGYKVRNGITIYVRFTLAYGKDIGGYDSNGGGYGALSSYCGLWINGGYQALGHDFVETDRLEPTETENGYIHYICSRCHEEKTDILPATGGGTEPTEPDPTEPVPTEPTPTEPSDPVVTDPTEPSPSDPSDPTPTEPTSGQARLMRRRLRNALAGHGNGKISPCRRVLKRMMEDAA